MDPIIKIFKSTDDLSREFATLIIAGIKEKNTGIYFTMALSGGSTPKSIFRFLSSNFKNKIQWERILVFWGDERCVEPENSESNFRMAKENLLNLVPIPEKNIFRIMGENEPSQESERYSEIVKKHVHLVKEIPQFDLVMLGLGDDGHTASIFPGHLDLFISKKFFDVAENPITKQKRITVTGSLINQAFTVIFLVTGKSKSEKVSCVLERKTGWESLPASMVQPVGGKVIWYLDELAAAEINRKDI